MAIVINGSGTVTGLAVGGLPDGTVDTDTLANTTVTAAKVAADVATQAEIDAKLPIASPTSTGVLTVNGGAVANAAKFNSTGAECSIQTINDSRTWSWGVRDIGSVANACFIHDNGASADRFVINTAGVVSIPQGIELGSGIDATAANILDDYEEGTWTASVAFGGNVAGQSYDNQSGWYVKVGGLVMASCNLDFGNKGSSTGNATLIGLPFASSIQFAPSWGYNLYITFGETYQGRNQGGPTVELTQTNASGVQSALTHSNFQGNSRIVMTMTYRTTA